MADDLFNYRLLDVWQLVFQKPWTRPRDVNQLIADLTDKIHRGELFVYLEPDLERDIPSVLRDGPPEGDGGFVDIRVLGYPADTPRTQDPVFITGNDEPQDAPLTNAVPQGEPEALKSSLNRWQVHRTVGLDTVVANGAGGETIGALYDKVYDHEGNPLPGVDLDTAQAFDEAYLKAQDISEMRAEGYRMVAEDAALGMVLGPAGGLGSRLARAGVGKGIAKSGTPNALQAANLKRFQKKIPSNSKDSVELRELPNDGIAAQATSPGRVPGSKAVYEKQIDVNGKTVQFTKTTYGPKGNIVHVKDKRNGGTYP